MYLSIAFQYIGSQDWSKVSQIENRIAPRIRNGVKGRALEMRDIFSIIVVQNNSIM